MGDYRDGANRTWPYTRRACALVHGVSDMVSQVPFYAGRWCAVSGIGIIMGPVEKIGFRLSRHSQSPKYFVRRSIIVSYAICDLGRVHIGSHKP